MQQNVCEKEAWKRRKLLPPGYAVRKYFDENNESEETYDEESGNAPVNIEKSL